MQPFSNLILLEENLPEDVQIGNQRNEQKAAADNKKKKK